MKEIASQCPTTLEELRTIDGLGEKKIQDYGPRMIRAIQNFVSKENLGEYLKERKQSKRPVKKQKVEKNTRYTHPTDQASSGVSKKSSASAPAVIVLDGNEDEEFDEFPLDLDLSTLDVP